MYMRKEREREGSTWRVEELELELGNVISSWALSVVLWINMAQRERSN